LQFCAGGSIKKLQHAALSARLSVQNPDNLLRLKAFAVGYRRSASARGVRAEWVQVGLG
jgi:hypothetical protein